MMACYKKSGFGSSITSPMSKDAIKFMGEIYVDDSNLLVCLARVLDLETVVAEAQRSLNAWAQLLNTTGGALNSDKCYWYAVHYVCINGEWMYGPRSECTLTIPLPDSSQAEIQQVNLEVAKKMLGVWSTPSGDDAKHLEEVIIGKTCTWVGRLKNCPLAHHFAWMAYRHQLWSGLWFGLRTLATHTRTMRSVLHSLEFEMLPLLGVN